MELNELQLKAYRSIMQPNSITVLLGEAGTGKSATMMFAAFELLRQKEIKRIVMSRPTVEMGRQMGFLPGDGDTKFSVYLSPLVDITNRLGNSGDKTFDSMVNGGQILKQPLQFIRGMTYFRDDLFVLDEAQNCLEEEILTVLTRMAEGSRLVITADIGQRDDKRAKGMERLLRIAAKLPYIQLVTLLENKRNPRITEITRCWEENQP